MQKKIEDHLKSLAQRVLTLNLETDLSDIKQDILQLYEELCVLEYLNNQTSEEVSPATEKEEITEPNVEEQAVEIEIKTESFSLFSIEEDMGVSPDFEDIFVKKDSENKQYVSKMSPLENTTLKDKIEAAKQSEKQEIINTELKPEAVINPPDKPKRSLNEQINKKFIQVDLNDRIAFVTHLFDGSQEDFNRVLSQLNSFEDELEAKDFLLNHVKPDYSWDGKEAYQERLLFLIERKFM